jgi:hypothetical protein
VLSGVDPDFREIKVKIRNDGTEGAFIRVYLDATPPAGGGCTPNGRILDKTVFVPAGNQTVNVFAEFGSQSGKVEFSCTNQSAVAGQTYTLVAAVDVNGDDSAACSEGALQSLACGNALADDDTDATDNRLSRNAPRIKKP